ncbi:MAG: hypothetical protein QG585_357 [Patescibacteria group bacterium]|nr:hypothetical protein [Patescibacteria group bacterium]
MFEYGQLRSFRFMSFHNFWLMREFEVHFQSGAKGLEIRVADPRRKSVHVGDVIVFNNRFHRRVIAIRRHSSFEEMLESEDSSRIVPGRSVEQILLGLRKIYGKKKEGFGVLVFELETVA